MTRMGDSVTSNKVIGGTFRQEVPPEQRLERDKPVGQVAFGEGGDKSFLDRTGASKLAFQPILPTSRK